MRPSSRLSATAVVVALLGVATAATPGQAALAAPLPAAIGLAAEPVPGTLISPPGFDGGGVAGINDSGQVIGSVQNIGGSTPAPRHGYVWRDGVRTMLPTLHGGSGTEPRDINTHGDIVGVCEAAPGDTTACLWRDGTVTDLCPGSGHGLAQSLNDKGEAVGMCGRPGDDGVTDVVLWRDGDVVHSLRPEDFPESVQELRPVELNNRSQVLLTANVEGDGLRTYLWQDGVLTDLGDVGGDTEGADLNDQGQVVGLADTYPGNPPGSDDRTYAFLWRDGQLSKLLPDVGHNTGADHVTDQGQILGTVNSPSDSYWYLWNQDRQVRLPLDAIGGMNKRGQLAGVVWTNGTAQAIAAQREEEDPTGFGIWELTDGSFARYVNDNGLVAGDGPDGAYVWQLPR